MAERTIEEELDQVYYALGGMLEAFARPLPPIDTARYRAIVEARGVMEERDGLSD